MIFFKRKKNILQANNFVGKTFGNVKVVKVLSKSSEITDELKSEIDANEVVLNSADDGYALMVDNKLFDIDDKVCIFKNPIEQVFHGIFLSKNEAVSVENNWYLKKDAMVVIDNHLFYKENGKFYMLNSQGKVLHYDEEHNKVVFLPIDDKKDSCHLAQYINDVQAEKIGLMQFVIKNIWKDGSCFYIDANKNIVFSITEVDTLKEIAQDYSFFFNVEKRELRPEFLEKCVNVVANKIQDIKDQDMKSKTINLFLTHLNGNAKCVFAKVLNVENEISL